MARKKTGTIFYRQLQHNSDKAATPSAEQLGSFYLDWGSGLMGLMGCDRV